MSRSLVSRGSRALRLVLLLALTLAAAPAAAQGDGTVVFAAASLKTALDRINADWKAETGRSATISYAGSSALARQIEQGAPAEIFVSADLDWMDYLEERDLIVGDTRHNLLGNAIVLIAPKDKAAPIEIAEGFDLANSLGEGRLAMANVKAVPAGKYGKAALETLGVWASVEGKLAQAENVRAALLLVSRGEAPLGIVYRTDAAADDKVAIVGTFPAASHPPIIYPAALLKAGEGEDDARAFLEFLSSDKARAHFEAQGFTILK